MKKTLFVCVALFCWTVSAAENLVTVKPPTRGTLHCITFWEVVCQVKCDDGYVPERAHAQSYIRSAGQWSTYPEGMEFPWADCVRASK